jgi:hypothetical protein
MVIQQSTKGITPPYFHASVTTTLEVQPHFCPHFFVGKKMVQWLLKVWDFAMFEYQLESDVFKE